MKNYDSAFAKLAKSKFRSRFHLSASDRKYIAEKGMATVRRHCEDFIRTRLAPASPLNDGKQTPMSGHPVFKAQHACACCCRGCLAKWWKVPRGVDIPVERQQGIVDFLMAWIGRELRSPATCSSMKYEDLSSFKCRGCGACCRIKDGIVRVSDKEISRIAAYLGVSEAEFIDCHTEIAPDRRGLILKDRPDGACAWLTDDNRCRIHPVKPDKCRTFPFEWTNPDSAAICPELTLCRTESCDLV